MSGMNQNMSCYDDIMAAYRRYRNDKVAGEKWAYKFINEILNDAYTELEIKNCLILILSLFFHRERDMFNSIGKLFQECEKKDKQKLIRLLLSDFGL